MLNKSTFHSETRLLPQPPATEPVDEERRPILNGDGAVPLRQAADQPSPLATSPYCHGSLQAVALSEISMTDLMSIT